MSKVFKEPDSYIRRVLKRFISRMNPSNYISDEPGPGPAPGTLTPFSVGQYITGIDFGNVSNGETSADMDAFLAGLTYDEDEQCPLVTFSPDATLLAMREPTSGMCALMVGDGNPLYCTQAFPEAGIPQGFNRLVDGKYDMSEAYGEPSFTVVTLYGVKDWNGILIGAVEGSAPSGLTEIKTSDSLTGFEFPVDMASADVTDVLAGLTYTDGMIDLIIDANTGNDDTGHGILLATHEESTYALYVGTKLDEQSGDISYADGEVFNSASGWSNALVNGQISIGITPTPTATDVSAQSGWNGVIVGLATA